LWVSFCSRWILFLLSVGSRWIVVSVVGLFLLSGLLAIGFVPSLVLYIPYVVIVAFFLMNDMAPASILKKRSLFGRWNTTARPWWMRAEKQRHSLITSTTSSARHRNAKR
jgi:hypothetical protein